MDVCSGFLQFLPIQSETHEFLLDGQCDREFQLCHYQDSELNLQFYKIVLVSFPEKDWK